MPQLVVILPETVDPHMVDQLTSAIHRMGGQIQPAEAPPEPQSEGEAINGARDARGAPTVPTAPMPPPA